MNRPDDTRRDPIWRTLLVLLLLTVGAALLGRQVAVDATIAWVVALSWTVAWLTMARFRWFGLRWWKTWLVLLVVAWLLALLGGRALAVPGMLVGVAFAMVAHGSLQKLSSRRRAVAFFMGLVAAVASLGLSWQLPEGKTGDIILLARTAVQAFWVAAVLILLFNMRLHFMRLRPKLFVTGVLVGVVPLMLLTVFGLLLLYGALGGSRANRARDVMGVWADSWGRGEAPPALAGPPVTWDEQTFAAGPRWAAELVTAARERRLAAAERRADSDETVGGERSQLLHETAGGTEVRFTSPDDDEPWLPMLVASADTTAWVRVGENEDVWLVRMQDPAPGQARVDALPVDARAMANLARFLRVDVELQRDDELGEGGVDAEGTAVGDSLATADASRLVGHYDPPPEGDAVTFWNRPRYFGGALIQAPYLRDGDLDENYMLVTLQTSFADLGREFFSTDNVFNIVLLVMLGFVALLAALAGLTALIFSLRITGGITDAVRSLHRGTRRLAEGDLDTRIEIPNEDEFGDLADSFNEMTTAVKQGREDALARERLMQEMETARKIQQRLLPHEQPLLKGWEITGVSVPSLQVGGDYFDFTSAGDDLLGIAIGDVSGKGVPAALLMSNLQACLKGQILHPAPVSDTVTRMNDLLSESTDPHMFATFFYGELDGTSGHFECCNAGHDPALVVRRDGTVEWITSGGLILGMFGDQEYEQVAVDLAPGDVLVLYTDGITEAGAPLVLPGQEPPELIDDADDDLFGEERLAEVVAAARERSAQGIREAVIAAVKEHLAGEPQGDDITLVVVKRGEELIP